MAILGVERVIFGVEDLATCTKFWTDFGLTPLHADDTQSVFEVESGSRVIVKKIDDPSLPPANFKGSGVRETTFGVDTAEALERLVAGLGREVRRGSDGAAHFLDIDGNAMALRVWAKRPVLCRPDAVNAPDAIVRLNQPRKWYLRARPRTINHIVYYSDDYVRSYEWYRDRLGFKMTDHAKRNGIFARADGTYEHHTMFWLTTNHPGTKGKIGFNHMAFGLTDIDEMMCGANFMSDQGWSNQRPYAAALNRHRISSAMYYYFPNPCGGDAEYHADTDYHDDSWVPRVWEMKMGAAIWQSVTAGFDGGDAMSWDVAYDYGEKSLEAWRGPPSGWPEPAAAGGFNFSGQSSEKIPAKVL